MLRKLSMLMSGLLTKSKRVIQSTEEYDLFALDIVENSKIKKVDKERFYIEEFSQTLDYGLEDITKLNHVNQVIDWENSSLLLCK